MNQTKTKTRLRYRDLEKIGNLLAIVMSTLIILQILFTETSLLLYAIELIPVIAMAGYYLWRELLFESWRESHQAIAELLSVNLANYRQRVFIEKENKNYFEAKLLRQKGFVLDLDDRIPEGRFLWEAKTLAEKARIRLEETDKAMAAARKLGVKNLNKERIRDALIVGDLISVQEILAEVRKNRKGSKEPSLRLAASQR